MHRENAHGIQPGRCLFSVLNVSWFLNTQGCDVSSAADNPVRSYPLQIPLSPGFQMAALPVKSFKKASIMEYDESKSLGITNASYPSAYRDLFIKILLTVSVNFFHCCQFHNLYLIPHIQDYTSLRTSKCPYRIKYRLFLWFVQGVIALIHRKIPHTGSSPVHGIICLISRLMHQCFLCSDM